MKATMANNAFLRYPDHNKPFHIYCDTSDLQLGDVITQDGAKFQQQLLAPIHIYGVISLILINDGRSIFLILY
jgi:RNase H-like domain found in reverse transcriptase